MERRSISSLCNTLLEEGVVNAIKDGRAHPVAVQMMNATIDLRKNELNTKFGGDLRKVKANNDNGEREKREYLRQEVGPDAVMDTFENSLMASHY